MNSHRVLPMLNSFAEIGEAPILFMAKSGNASPCLMLRHMFINHIAIREILGCWPSTIPVCPRISPLTWLVGWLSLSCFGHLNNIYLQAYLISQQKDLVSLLLPYILTTYPLYSYHISFLCEQVALLFTFDKISLPESHVFISHDQLAYGFRQNQRRCRCRMPIAMPELISKRPENH